MTAQQAEPWSDTRFIPPKAPARGEADDPEISSRDQHECSAWSKRDGNPACQQAAQGKLQSQVRRLGRGAGVWVEMEGGRSIGEDATLVPKPHEHSGR
jgi:hypothetical protein